MKRSVFLFLVLTLIVGFCSESTFAVQNDTNIVHEINASEYSSIYNLMNMRGLTGDIEVSVLYDTYNEPSYLLGTSNTGYLIMSRSTLRCVECGQGNPYVGYDEVTKYYGGVCNYYVPNEGKFFDISRGRVESSMRTLDSLSKTSEDLVVSHELRTSTYSSTSSVSSIAILPFQEEWIRKKAFGYNDDNTCSAVACTLALSYIDNYNNDVVPARYELEDLTYGYYTSAQYVENNYPNAHSFHRYLVEDCGMIPGSFCGDIALGIEEYSGTSNLVGSTNIQARWVLNVTGNDARECLRDDRPALLTSTVVGDYDWHTMLVYGYRTFSDGTAEWLVHPGWYSHVSYSSAYGYHRVSELWVSAETATFLYIFTYDEQ